MRKIIDKESIVLPRILDYKKEYILVNKELPKGVVLNNQPREDLLPLNSTELRDFKGVGERFLNLARKEYNSGANLLVPRGVKIDDTITIQFSMDQDNPTVINYNTIVAEEDSDVNIIIDYTSSKEVKAYYVGLTKIYAKDRATVNIIKVQRMGDRSFNLDSNIGITEGGGKINWLSVEIGSSISSTNFSTYLTGQASKSNLSSMYLGDGDRKLDLEYNMVHMAPRSISNIDTKGVLKDKARKMFKGNLDFKKGSRLSEGIEEEYVILLDPTVKSDSIPALLSHEDDVIGEHAASAGQINENKLFYLMSRGLDESRAKKLIVEASFRPIIDKIPFKDLKDLISDEVERRLMDE